MFYKKQLMLIKRLCRRVPKLGGHILQMDTGLGKTRTSLEIARRLKRPVVCLVPTGLIDDWIVEQRKLGGADFQVLKNYAMPEALSDHVLASYHCLNFPEFIRAVNSRKRTIIVDELANFKNEKAQRSKQLRKIMRGKVHYGIGLTATVIENAIEELYNLLRIVAPKFMSPTRWLSDYAVVDSWGTVVEYRNLQKFRKKAMRYLSRLRRDEVEDLPSQTKGRDYVFMIEPPAEFVDEHLRSAGKLLSRLGQLRDSMVMAEMAGSEDEEATKLYEATVHRVTSMRRIAKLRAQLCDVSGLGSAKVAFIRKLFQRWTQPDSGFSGFPCLIFCDNVEQAKALRDIIASWGFVAGLITGATPQKKRTALRNAFNAGTLSVIVSSAAGSRGNNLQGGKSLIHYSIPWTDAVMKQRNRIRRASSKAKQQKYILLVLKNTVDEYLLSIVRDKAHQARVFDEGSADFVKSRSKSWTVFLKELMTKGGPNAVTPDAKEKQSAGKHRNKGCPRGYTDERFWCRKRQN